MGDVMKNRFGICLSCLDQKAIVMTGFNEGDFFELETSIYKLEHFSKKASYLKCSHCGKLKSSEWAFTPSSLNDPLSVSQAIRAKLQASDQMGFGRVSLADLAEWLDRESEHIRYHGRDYWVDGGVLFFYGSGESFKMTLNDEVINLEDLLNLFN
jgi:hypothetical protein